MVLIKAVYTLKICQHTKFHGPTLTGVSFASSQMFESPSCWNYYSHGIKNYGVEVTFNDMTSLLNFIKICQLVKKLIGGYIDAQRQDGYLISLYFSFKSESKLKMRDLLNLSKVTSFLQVGNNVVLKLVNKFRLFK
jgi:hypothetical protein